MVPANNPYSIAVSEAQWWLTDACKRFDQAVPGLADTRDVLVHFDDYACGKGKLQRRLLDQRIDAATAARQFWPFGYDPATGTAQVGPYEINIGQAVRQARQLRHAIYAAARAVDAAAASMDKGSRTRGSPDAQP